MMAGLVVALGVLGFFLAAPYGIAGILVPSGARPPRHARPAGRTGPTERAPSPPVATWTPEQRAAFGSISPTWKLSPLSRESLRRRFRIMWAVHTGRPVV
jgi:hypothetical protein